MGITSWIGKSIGKFILVVALSTAIALMAAADATDSQNLRPFLVNLMVSEATDQVAPEVRERCSEPNTKSVTLDLQELDVMVDVECRDVDTLSNEGVTGLVSGKVFDAAYGKDRLCSGFDCLRRGTPLGLLTDVSHQGFQSMAILAFIGAVAGVAIIAISLRRRGKIVRAVGGGFIAAGIPLFFVLLGGGLLTVPDPAQQFVANMLTGLALAYGIVFFAGIGLYFGGRKLEKSDKEYAKHEKKRKHSGYMAS